MEKPENNYTLRIGNNYYINERKEALKYTMINDINGILQLRDKD